MFALIFTAALDSAPVALPGPGTYRYEAFINGKTVGKNRLVVTPATGGVRIDEDASANLETGDSKAQSSMVVDVGMNVTR
ncbi:MAG: hypothetical protein NVS9B12_11300 [Vulcanimicrobiaceae bacterium]